jgi:hypothetical protein
MLMAADINQKLPLVFNDRELAPRFSVKPRVREAPLPLQRELLVEVALRQGRRGAPKSISDAADMCSFRSILESAWEFDPQDHFRVSIGRGLCSNLPLMR